MRILFVLLCFVPALLIGQVSNLVWQNYALGSPALKVKLPGQPSPQEAKLPQQAMSYIKKYDASYLKDDANGIVVTMMYAWYANNVVADGLGAIDGTNNQWENTGTKVAIINTENVKISGKSAVKQMGKLIIGGQEHDYMDIVVVEGSMLWQIIVMVRANDTSLKAVMQKITDSITF
jgi:hypothetical protein